MCRVRKIAVLIVVFAFVTGLALPALVQAGQAPAPAKDPEKQKISELLKLHLLLAQGEHTSFHEALEKLAKKYPNDPEIKALSEEHHTVMHRRMTTGEQAIDLLTKKYLAEGGD